MTNTALAGWAYRAATTVAAGAAPAFLRWRQGNGKEDPERLGERLGHATIDRPDGPLVWLHGASVGEGLALLPLITGLRTLGYGVLLTTGTVTSSRVVAARLPPGAVHQFVPLDVPSAVRRFVDHWHPDLAVFAESDLWPNLLRETTRRGTPAALVNARMSARSFARWRRLPDFAETVLGLLDPILAQSDVDATRFSTLARRPIVSVGNLKFDAEPPDADSTHVDGLHRSLNGRPVWIAASTHSGEDQICTDVHRDMKPSVPSLLTIIVPRKVDRGAAIVAQAKTRGLTAVLRSRNEALTAETDIYVADTMGEIGLFYRLGAPVFVGKSLGPQGGGQNPIEPAKLGNAILHGPETANFAEIYADFDAAGAATCVVDAPALAERVAHLLTAPDALATQADRARAHTKRLGGATERTLAQLRPLLIARAR